MATYYANKVVLNVAGQNVVQPKWLEDRVIDVLASITFPTGTTLNAGDTIQFMDVPAAATITGCALSTGKLDGSGSPTLTLNVGDAANASRYFAAANTGQAGGYVGTNQNGVLGNSYSTVTRVYGTVVAGSAAASTAPVTLIFKLSYGADA